MLNILIQLSNLILGTALFESGREWGFILVIAAAYFEGGKVKIHECNSFQKLASQWQQWEEKQVLRISGEALPVCIQIHVNDFIGGILRLHYCVWWVEPSQQSSQPPLLTPQP